MAERREAELIRTSRPGINGLPTVAELIALPPFVDGQPEVLTAGDTLAATVHWAHVSDSPGVARLLDGGELLLSTGSGWPTEPEALRAFIVGLAAARIAGIVLELGSHYRYVPRAILDAAVENRIALIALHREVKFIALTQAVHGRIISVHSVALRARDEVRELFTGLALRGSPTDYVVQQLAQTLNTVVVLEDLAHEIVTAAPVETVEGLEHWERRSRATRTGEVTAQGWLSVEVGARGIRWGRLIALPGPAHPAGREAVLEQGSIALAIARLADRNNDEWSRLSRQRLVDALLAGRFVSLAGLIGRLEAGGLPVHNRTLTPLVILTKGAHTVDIATVDAAASEFGGRAIAGLVAEPVQAVVVVLSLPVKADFTERMARKFVRTFVRYSSNLIVGVGSAMTDVLGLLAGVKAAINIASASSEREERGLVMRYVANRPLLGLVTALRHDHRLQELSEQMLAPLIEHDLRYSGDLLDVLAALLAHPSNRTAAAAASHLSRSVFYQRLAVIEDLLQVDLDDGETLTALYLSLLLRRN